MDSHRSGKLGTRAAAWLGLFATVLLTGCEPALPGRDAEGARDFNSRTLVAGENVVRLHQGLNVHIFEAEALADQDIEIIATSTAGAKLGIGFAESPDGREFKGYPGADLVSTDGRFRVEPQSAGDEGTGFRFLGTATGAGTWRFSILAQPRLTRERASEILANIDWCQNWVAHVMLAIYMLVDQPTLSCGVAEFFYWNLPEVVLLYEPLDITVRIRTAQAGELIDPDDITDDADGTNGGDGGDGDGDGTDGDGTDGDGTDGDGTDGDGTDGGDNGTSDDDPGPPQAIVFQAIVRTGDEVPEQDDATFTYFGNPIIDDDGRVAFFAAYEGGDGDAGLYVWEDQQLTRVFDTGSSWTGNIPGLGAEDYFGDITIRWNQGSPHLAWGSNGRLLFVASINGFSQPNALFRWRASDGDLLLVSNAELMRTAIPDSTDEFLPEFYHVGLADDGTAFFSNRYTYFRQDGSLALFKRGVFSTDGETTTEIGIGDVPEQPAGAFFYEKPVLITSHNAAGELLFQATYFLGAGSNGVYLLADGELYRAIDNADSRSFDGLPAGAQVNSVGDNYQAIAVGEQGHIAIDTTLTVGGETRDTVLLWDNTRWYELQSATGQYATHLLTSISDDGEVAYLADEHPHLGAVSQSGIGTIDLAAFLPAELRDANLQWEPYGAAINNHGRALLRYTRVDDDAPGLALWTGREWLVVLDGTEPFALDTIDAIFSDRQYEPDDLDRVGSISDRPETNRPGLSGMLNDSDEWTLRAASLGTDGRTNTADDEQAIFLGHGE
ncbi:MAG: hypothetical protein KKI02_03995 [Planctomycetes bacterium]|nr:hypothetical protein [Planctomycetota bacterium]